MHLENKTVFVTGANRGIGKALVAALLKHKVKKVYAGARNPDELPDFSDDRVVPVKLDITNFSQIKKAAMQADDIDLLINNAGVLSSHEGLIASNYDQLLQEMNVNYFGTINMARVFAPVLAKKKASAIANVISVLGLVSMPNLGGYCASKAALFSATQSLRVELKPNATTVHGVFPGPIDTDMSSGLEMEKASVETTAENILKGISADIEDIYPDPVSEQASVVWSKNPKQLEKQFSGL
jgi:NAD(P)-dependent dehydrogenase (short-subunit alcohol dehydrogenase family)